MVAPAPPKLLTHTAQSTKVLIRYIPTLTRIVAVSPFTTLYHGVGTPEGLFNWSHTQVQGTLWICAYPDPSSPDSSSSSEESYQLILLNHNSPKDFHWKLVSPDGIEVLAPSEATDSKDAISIILAGSSGHPANDEPGSLPGNECYGLYFWEDNNKVEDEQQQLDGAAESSGGQPKFVREEFVQEIVSCATKVRDARERREAESRMARAPPTPQIQQVDGEYTPGMSILHKIFPGQQAPPQQQPTNGSGNDGYMSGGYMSGAGGGGYQSGGGGYQSGPGGGGYQSGGGGDDVLSRLFQEAVQKRGGQ